VILGTLFLIYWSKRAKVFLSHWVELNEEWVIIMDKDEQKEKCWSNADDSKNSSKLDQCRVNIET